LRGKLKKDGHILYNEENTPYTNKYIITYSTSQDLSTYSMLNAKVYARCIIGSYYSTWLVGKREKAIKQIQKYVSNFWNDTYLLVGDCHYISKK
jgi:hypothetical protein